MVRRFENGVENSKYAPKEWIEWQKQENAVS